MTDSMTFGPEWLRNLSSEGSTGGTGTRYQLADYRYGREEMLALFEKGLRAPLSLSSFNPLYSESVLPPLALLPHADEERSWSNRSVPLGNSTRGRGTASLDRGGRGGRGRGSYQTYNNRGGYDNSGGWTGADPPTEWSPRKDYTRAISVDNNWRRHRTGGGEDDEGWRNTTNNHVRVPLEKWERSKSWRDGGEGFPEERGGGGQEKQSNRASWQEGMRGSQQHHRRPWENEDHLPEWATENSAEMGGSFDSSGAFHGCSDDEQRENKPGKRDVPLQKSISQQNITVKTHPNSLPSSQSAVLLSKPPDEPQRASIEPKPLETVRKDTKLLEEKHNNNNNSVMKIDQMAKPPENDTPKVQNEHKMHFNSRGYNNESGGIDVNGLHNPDHNRANEEFERIQEDFITKLVVDEDVPKKGLDNFMLPTVAPPPNLVPPTQDTWYYQDPQGDMQGPFPSSEMAEWFKAGYFTSSLLVKRLCDTSFYRLGDLVSKCTGNPFEDNVRITAPIKQQEIINPVVSDELLKFQMLQRQLMRQAELRALSENEGPWGMQQQQQQRDLMSQQVLAHQQMATNMQFFQQPPQQQQQPQPQQIPNNNPLMTMINQMHQANKLPSQILSKNPPAQLDPIQALVQQMGGMQAPNAGLPTNIPNSGLLNSYGTLPTPLNAGYGSSLHNSESLNKPGLNEGSRLPPRPTPLGAVDSLSTAETDPIKTLLQKLQNKPQMDSMWQQNQFGASQPNSQTGWQSNDLSMWDVPSKTANVINPVPLEQQPQQTTPSKSQEKERQRMIKENVEKERRQKEMEEKLAKKEAEERRKEEQRRQEVERKAAEDKRKKDEEHIRRELEKAKKEAEEKRLRELEEKRRLKEQRKIEEENRRKMEEQRRLDESERVKREIKEREEQIRARQLEHERELKAALQHQQQQRTVPWSQQSSTPELSLADIQRAERERRAEQVVQQQQQKAHQVLQEQRVVMENPQTSFQMNWLKKNADSKSIKSFAEIQQEQQEKLAKQAMELRAALKEKEASAPINIPSLTPWSGQGLSWASTNQWNNNIGGFWDDSIIQTQTHKPPQLAKSNSASVVKQAATAKQNKHKLKKEEQQVMKLFSNGPVTDEFTNWCTSTLTRLHSTVDIPTFINFLRDIESALEVKDYCKEYFGDVPATQQFVTQFLEKRRMFKPKNVTQTDDMSSPAPAITPSIQQHSTEFQEVKGKGKKSKKSKMIKVDARNLGFSVTAAPDRLNVGDRDYVEN